MYKIKQIPEDFIVKEVSSIKPGKEGEFSYFAMKKRNYSTINAVEAIARKLRIDKKFIGFAGNKDKIAVTEQMVSIRGTNVKGLKLADIGLTFLGKGNERINLGDLEGNKFVVTVRNLEEKKKVKVGKMVNYFDEQRFGKEGRNHLIGREIIKGNFKKALELIGKKTQGKDYVGQLRKINKKLLKLYIHSYQSYLWNEVVKQMAEERIKVEKVPLFSFDTDFNNKETEKLYEKLLEREGIGARDFIIREMPDLTPVSVDRSVFAHAKDFSYRYEEDELNKGRLKCILKFYLPKGSYATCVVKEIFS